VTATADELAELIEANPDTGWCLVGAAGTGWEIAELVAGRPPPSHLDDYVAQLIPESPLVQAGSIMVPKVMDGDQAALADGLKSYADGLRLWDRQRAWDVCDLMPAVARTVLERWDELGPSLNRLDEITGAGGHLAGAATAAIREEVAAASGGPPPKHDQLKTLGFLGISELLRYRPTSRASAA
jgi:hypothetical protein